MSRLLYICYCISCSGYSADTRNELYELAIEAAKNGELDIAENTLIEVYGIAIGDE